ncbi:hypothetical protein SAMN05216198_1029 [Halopseudomonas litoralis]|uniref:Uncharacterized protein n=1 Tax=Halopseudomonas litoralis TaxID=797277 RepID=A0A1H1NWU1_9GAMM|nr:hypothetical protein [Halopseudomonas litoralis]SDS03260.1 hypothetical protein SAMN05216198_1029 [Halopseudomonas litoralis]
MPKVIALHSFTHNGESRARHSEWPTSEKDAAALARAGLVRIKGGEPAAAIKPAPTKKPAARKKPAAPKQPTTKADDPKPGQLTA